MFIQVVFKIFTSLLHENIREMFKFVRQAIFSVLFTAIKLNDLVSVELIVTARAFTMNKEVLVSLYNRKSLFYLAVSGGVQVRHFFI